MSEMWENAPHVANWFAAIRARPSYDIAYYPGTKMIDLFPKLREKAQS